MTLPNPEQSEPLLTSLLDEALAAPDAQSPDMLALSQHTLAGTTPLLPHARNRAMDHALAAAFETQDTATTVSAGLADAVLQQTQNQISRRAQNVNHSRWADAHLHHLLEEALSLTANEASSAQSLAGRIAAATSQSTVTHHAGADDTGVNETSAVIGRIGFATAFAQPRFAVAAGIGLLLVTVGLFALVAGLNPGTISGPDSQTAGTDTSQPPDASDLDTLVAQAVAPLQSSTAVSDLDDNGYTTADSLSAQLVFIEATPLWASPQDALDTTLTLESIEFVEDDNWTVF